MANLRSTGSSGVRLSRWLAIAWLCAITTPASADFDKDLARIDKALRSNPSRVMQQAVDACLKRRRFAIQLMNTGQEARANRSLKRCFQLLQIPEQAPKKQVVAPPTAEELHAKAQNELDKALTLEPNLENGLAIYRECAACHLPEGSGLESGSVPQIAGQHRKVVIKQLADIRAGNRDATLMIPYSSPETIGGAQGVADVAGYIDTLEIHVTTGKGSGEDLGFGKQLYTVNCVRCHGENGEGNNETYIPRIQSQHFGYLKRQFQWIRDGKRRNANAEMVKQIQGFGERETDAVLDYVSRLEPPPELQAPPGWTNPDFSP